MLGDGDDDTLRRRIRAQANFTEYTPLALIGLALCELSHAPPSVLMGLGATLLLGRTLHAASLYQNTVPIRVVGMVATYSVLLLQAIWLFMQCLGSR